MHGGGLRCSGRGLLQDVGVRFAAGDERQVEFVLVEWYVVAVDRLASRLLQSGQVHHGAAHHVVVAPAFWHSLEETLHVSTAGLKTLSQRSLRARRGTW